MKRTICLLGLTFLTVSTRANSVGATGMTRSNYYHGTMCQGPTSGSVTYSEKGTRAALDTVLVCPAPWSADTGSPLQLFSFKAYWTGTGLAAPTCTMVINTSTDSLTLVGSPVKVIQSSPGPNTASSTVQAIPPGIVADIRRAYMRCTGVVNNAGIDGYSLDTCFGATVTDCS
jgi:hypothetical protein